MLGRYGNILGELGNEVIKTNSITISLSLSLSYFSGLCPDFYPDAVCRSNFTLHSYDPPLLYDLHSDPGEIYPLDVKQYNDVMKQIEMVSL